MSSTLYFNAETDVTDQWMDYLVQEAQELSEKSELEIRHYADKEILNPQVKEFLEQDDETGFLPLEVDEEDLTISFKSAEALRPMGIMGKFRRTKLKIRKIFCKVVKDLEDLDFKGIIKAVILAAIPAFATGLPAAILPIIIALVALFIKYGFDRVCPVV